MILRIKQENRLWGPKRIHGELLKLGFKISETSVKNVLRRINIDPWDGQSSGTWREFVRRHNKVWAFDFLAVHTGFMKRIYILVIINIPTRELVAAKVAPSTSQEWTVNYLKWTIPNDTPPAAIIHDREPTFEGAPFKSLLNSLQIKNFRCPSRSPIANAFAERMNGTIRRECTNHFLFFSEKQLQYILNQYQDYYNLARCHQGINQRTPMGKNHALKKPAEPSQIKSKEHLSGLHHEYFEAA